LIWSEDEWGQQRLIDVNSRTMLQVDRSLALRSFCRAFLAGEPSNTLRWSCEGMKVLQGIGVKSERNH